MRALFLLPLLIACARHGEAPATVAEPPAASGPFLYASATRTAEPTPARFAGPLPDTSLAAFWFERAWGSTLEYVPAMGAALGRIAAGDDSWLTRQAAVAHGKLDDVRVARDLLAAPAAARDARVRGQIIAGMSEQSDPRAKAIFEAYCVQPDTRETLCPGKARVVIGAEPPLEPADPEAPLRDPAGVHSALQDGDRQATGALLTGLRTLADRDWAAAHALAATLTPGPRTDPTLADTVAALARFGSRAEVETATRANRAWGNAGGSRPPRVSGAGEGFPPPPTKGPRAS